MIAARSLRRQYRQPGTKRLDGNMTIAHPAKRPHEALLERRHGGGVLTDHFNCRNCNALYHLIKVDAGPETINSEIACRVCGAPLAAREGSAVLKYFLLREPARPDPRARQGSQRAKPVVVSQTRRRG